VIETQRAHAAGTNPLFEAAFEADGVFVAVDVLLRDGDGYTLIEVKSASKAKDEHIPDAAVQVHVLRTSGVTVNRVEIMHLNGEFRHPDQGDLFTRTDITAAVEAFLPQVPALLDDARAALDGPLPEIAIGLRCFEPRDCPFHDRCWPDDPWHISTLYNTGPRRTDEFLMRGIHSIRDLPANHKLPEAAQRQVKALAGGTMIVEPRLGQVLREELGDARLGYLDFETINRAVPVWNGLGPWRAAVVQFSYHEDDGRGTHAHSAFLAEGPHDPRPELAERMLAATAGAEKIVMYSSFERTRIKELAEQVPALAEDLHALAGKLVDLLPIVRNHVYHPDFRGSFSLKYILSPLVPDLTYNDLAIVDGLVASVEIARLLFVAHLVEDRDQLRKDLLAYCERDTWAMVRLVQRLRELSRPQLRLL
jgi:predicted RecB family nuclease